MKTIRIMIVDDHPLMRRALTAIIKRAPDLGVVGSAVNGVQAQEFISELQPDVVLMDLLMPGGDGFDAIVAIQAEYPNVNILVITSVEEQEHILQAIKAGAQGYLTKAADSAEILEAIRTVSKGQTYLPPNITDKLMKSIRSISQEAQPGPNLEEILTQRELEIFNLLGQGLTNVEIGQTLHISAGTVNVHIHNIMKKLGYDKRRGLVAFAFQQQQS